MFDGAHIGAFVTRHLRGFGEAFFPLVDAWCEFTAQHGMGDNTQNKKRPVEVSAEWIMKRGEWLIIVTFDERHECRHGDIGEGAEHHQKERDDDHNAPP